MHLYAVSALLKNISGDLHGSHTVIDDNILLLSARLWERLDIDLRPFDVGRVLHDLRLRSDMHHELDTRETEVRLIQVVEGNIDLCPIIRDVLGSSPRVHPADLDQLQNFLSKHRVIALFSLPVCLLVVHHIVTDTPRKNLMSALVSVLKVLTVGAKHGLAAVLLQFTTGAAVTFRCLVL